jgi:hypothetical protein
MRESGASQWRASPDTNLPFFYRSTEGLQGGPMGMNRTFKATAAALMLAVGFAGSVAAGPFEAAVAAHEKGLAAYESITPWGEGSG